MAGWPVDCCSGLVWMGVDEWWVGVGWVGELAQKRLPHYPSLQLHVPSFPGVFLAPFLHAVYISRSKGSA